MSQLGGTYNEHVIQLPDQKLQHVIKGIVQRPLRHWQTGVIDSLSRKPVPVFDRTHCKERLLSSFLLDVLAELTHSADLSSLNLEGEGTAESAQDGITLLWLPHLDQLKQNAGSHSPTWAELPEAAACALPALPFPDPSTVAARACPASPLKTNYTPFSRLLCSSTSSFKLGFMLPQVPVWCRGDVKATWQEEVGKR